MTTETITFENEYGAATAEVILPETVNAKNAAVLLIHEDFSAWILERAGGRREIHAMLVDIRGLFGHVPHKTARLSIHDETLS